ncbi:MAG TPA: GTP-binding protein [Candidatus Saccharimonadales bacterium]|nr:GTP-binding protein [Candidatus Saccharimonadales bacterium]
MKKIPITAITGFLGSGKTTLLNHILTNNQGLKIGVVVNDYGDINIDQKLVAGQTDKTLELTNGCICCSLGTLELDEAIGQFAYPGSDIDYIVIEASGLAEPADLALTLREASGRHTRLDSIVTVLDAANLESNAEAHTTALQQIEYSDFVIINKTDLVDREKIDQIKMLITGINNRARIFTTDHSQIDVRLLLDKDAHDLDFKIEHNHTKHLHDDYQTVSFSSDQPLDPVAFQQFVNDQIPPEVYRAKGFVNLGKKGHRRKYIFQLVGKRADLSWTDWGEEKPQTQLVFIGRDFNQKQLIANLESAIDKQSDKYDPDQQVVLPKHRS